jgi:hypothetical protein
MKNLNEIEKDVFEVSARLKHIQEDIVRLQTKETEFKVPGWYMYREPGRVIVFRATQICGNYFEDDRGESYFIYDCRPAIKEEIESHLRKVAEEKGLIKFGIRLKDADDGLISISQNTGYEYRPNYDSFVVSSEGEYAVTNLYFNGKWAEIIPSKKKLPKTKEEFGAFLGAYCNRHTSSVDEFLNDYEDK